MPKKKLPAAGQPLEPRCEYATNPLGIDEAHPRFSWIVNDTRRGAVQTAYQVMAASSIDLLNVDAPDLWDSGNVAAATSFHVTYAGVKLKSRLRCHWKVRTWDAQGTPSAWCPPQWWEMGLLHQRDWGAQWIGPADDDTDTMLRPCPHLRGEWTVPAAVANARLYVSARGLHALSLNGTPITEAAFLPGWTDYRQRIPYHVFDVTPLLKAGSNVMGAILANGWYAGHLAWLKQVYGKSPRLLLQLEITFTDGKRQRFTSDDAWTFTNAGPIRHADMLKGEAYDARLEMPGWDQPGFDAAGWRAVVREPLGSVPLDAHAGPPVRALATLAPRNVTESAPGVHVFDLGQNMVGHVRLRVPASLPPGTTLTLRHAEMLNADGSLYLTNLRQASATDTYITRGGGATTWEPRFTFHGFRYVELSGLPAAPGKQALAGIVQHSDTPFGGEFACSHAGLNQLQHNIQWGQRGNFLEVPTDCPQRDERLGWMGDAQIFCRTACFNADVAAFFTQWMTNVVDAQRPDGGYPVVAPDVMPEHELSAGWADAGLIVPWTLYRCYGDRRMLERHYESFKRFIACQTQMSPGHIGPDQGYGDWLQVDTFTPLDLIATAYYAHSVDLMRRIATVLDRRGDLGRYTTLLKRIRLAFARRFVTPDGRLAGDTQAAYVLALAFDLVPAALREAALRNLIHQIDHGRSAVWPYRKRNGHLSTGFLAVDKICEVLARGGRLDYAYKLLLNETYPSWLFPVKHGATTIWERWDGWTPEKGFADPGMNSFNHYAYGAIGSWLYQAVAGLDLAEDAAGYTHVRLHPRPPPARPDGTMPLTHARAATKAITGRVQCGWRCEGDALLVDITLPANTRATVTLPAPRAGVTEAGKRLPRVEGVSHVHDGAEGVTFALAAGVYSFACRQIGKP